MSRPRVGMSPRVAIRQVHLEHLDSDLSGLDGYERALIVFRLQGAVVGQDWLPVKDGCVSAARIRSSLKALAWNLWTHVVSPQTDRAMPMQKASIVVCTRDRTDELADCLHSLLPIVDQGYEVIIVDNCPSDDSTAQLVAEYPDVRYIHEPTPGLDMARNTGLRVASGEIVAFTDDDVRVDPGWLSALLRNFDDPLVGVATGITLPAELETDAQIWFEWTNGFGRGFVRQQFDASNTNVLATGRVGAGANMAIRRSILKETGFFDEALDGGTLTRSGGDQEFFYRVLACGFRIVYDPAAVVWHRHRREWESLRKTFYGYGVGLFAWWTRALVVEKEWSLLKLAPRWFWQHHVQNLIRALLRHRGHIPLDLAWAEFRGGLAGPGSYLESRRQVEQRPFLFCRDRPYRPGQHTLEADSLPVTSLDQRAI